MNATATAGYTETQRTMAREGLEVHDAGCCTQGARCWMAEGLERIAASTRSTVVVAPENDTVRPRSNGNSTGRGRVADTATEKQMSYIGSMLAELESAPADFPGVAAHNMLRAALVAGESIGKREASAIIEKLKGDIIVIRSWKASAPKAEVKADPAAPAVKAEEITVGMYKLDSKIVKVNESRSTGRLYATVLIPAEDECKGSFEYAPGLIRKLTPAHRLTLAEAAEFGHLNHFCACCGRELTHPESVSRGLGPICADKL